MGPQLKKIACAQSNVYNTRGRSKEVGKKEGHEAKQNEISGIKRKMRLRKKS